MKKVTTIVLLLLATVIGGYLLWSASGRTAAAAGPDLYLDEISSYGVNANGGNLVAVQPYMETTDYASQEAFSAKMDGYMAAADAQGWLQSDTIVVFPELLSTWLVAANEKEDLYAAESLDEGMQLLVLSNLPMFLEAYAAAQGEDKVVDSLFRMKAGHVAQIVQDTFSELASEYGVTIVAGSLFLPDPQVVDGDLIPGQGALQNVGLVFRADGSLYPTIVRKVFLTGDELPIAAPGRLDQSYTFDTPAGRLAVLICADSWYPEVYETLAAQAPEFIVVPNNYPIEGGWDAIWAGYDSHPVPDDVDQSDIGRITEGEARLKYTLAGPGRMARTGAHTGLHVFTGGDLWDMHLAGHTIIFTEDGIIEGSEEARGALVNYWLPE